MGHTHLVRLPGTRKWREVVALLTQGAEADEVVSAAAVASEGDLAEAARNPVFVEAIRLLCQIPLSAQADNFAAALRLGGLDAGPAPSIIDVVVAATMRLEEVQAKSRSADDFSELSARAMASTLGEAFTAALPGLLDPNPEIIQTGIRKFSNPEGFEKLSRLFFRKLLDGTLRYWLDRVLPIHTGPDSRFRSLGDRGAFDAAMTQYVFESTRIIKEFSRGWYGKVIAGTGTVPADRVAAFGHVAFKKIGEELRRKRDADD
ncbi:hypothetical protein [Tabrizicola aquatica]|uniref:hypothetical protein n=1 Tax=Tabrizicola aquatica TaxID=909926 RepID=UPI0011AEEC8C|nr:hypothetical protein [Tabrizicola aquatica]